MQQYEIYSIYDRKAKVYHNPCFCYNVADAIRMHTVIFSDGQSMFNQFPDDYQIFKLGSFANDTGKIVSLSHPEYVCSAEDLLQTKKGVKNVEDHSENQGKRIEKNNDKTGQRSGDGATLGKRRGCKPNSKEGQENRVLTASHGIGELR